MWLELLIFVLSNWPLVQVLIRVFFLVYYYGPWIFIAMLLLILASAAGLVVSVCHDGDVAYPWPRFGVSRSLWFRVDPN